MHRIWSSSSQLDTVWVRGLPDGRGTKVGEWQSGGT